VDKLIPMPKDDPLEGFCPRDKKCVKRTIEYMIDRGPEGYDGQLDSYQMDEHVGYQSGNVFLIEHSNYGKAINNGAARLHQTTYDQAIKQIRKSLPQKRVLKK
jgi:hypothetical protein